MKEYRIMDHKPRVPVEMTKYKRSDMDERRTELQARKIELRFLMPNLTQDEIEENWQLIMLLAKNKKSEKEIINYLRKGSVHS